MRVSILNIESLLSGPIWVNSTWSSFMYLSPLSHPLKFIPTHILLEWISKLLKLLGVYSAILHELHFLSLLSLKEPAYLSLVIDLKASGGPWASISIVLPDTFLRAGYYWFDRQWGIKSLIQRQRTTWQEVELWMRHLLRVERLLPWWDKLLWIRVPSQQPQ